MGSPPTGERGGRPLGARVAKVRGLATGLEALDAIGEGRVPLGAVMLLAGDPGVGKSTVALLLALAWSRRGGLVKYLAFEEGLEPILRRAALLGRQGTWGVDVWQTWPDHLASFELGLIPPVLWIVDSLQRAPLEGYRPLSPSHAVAVVERAQAIVAAAPAKRTALLLCHVDKEGAAAGPNTVAHLVDVVLYVERPAGPDDASDRLVTIEKNRFGPCRSTPLEWPFRKKGEHA